MPIPPLERARVAALYAQPAVSLARTMGADMEKLAAASGLRLDGVLSDDVPVKAFMALLAAAARQLNDPFFGLHVGQTMQISNYVGYGLVLCTCKSIGETAEQTIRFESLCHDLGRTEVGKRGDIGFVRWRSPWQELDGFRQTCDLVAATLRSANEWLVGMKLPTVEADFIHAAPSDAPLDEYEALLGAKLRFGAEFNEARFPALLFDLPVANADVDLFPELSRVSERRLAARRREISEPSIVPAVRERIHAQLNRGKSSLPEVAEAMGLTPRTLQRRLAEGQVGFSDLLDEVRRELVQRYLRDEKISLVEVAFLLGFSEQSTFNHAFRAWFETTPKAWRER